MSRDDLVSELSRAGYVVVTSRVCWLEGMAVGLPEEPSFEDLTWLMQRI